MHFLCLYACFRAKKVLFFDFIQNIFLAPSSYVQVLVWEDKLNYLKNPFRFIFILREPTSQDQLTYILYWKIPIHWKSFYKKCALFVINRLLVLTTFCWLMASLKHEKIVPIIYSFYGLKVLKFIHSHFLKRNFYCCWGH